MHRWLIALLCSSLPFASLDAQAVEGKLVVRAFGDVNLGRAVGQQLLKGNIDYPFAHAGELLERADVVFVNLESQLSDQGGITQDPKDPFIFCGPPEGAQSLRQANISIVSTANNHAWDYGRRGLVETIEYLSQEGIAVVGTTADASKSIEPVILERNGIRLGFVAYTQFVNRAGEWKGLIALYDERRAREDIRDLRRRADVVIASFHGGAEYADEPPGTTRRQMQALSDFGAQVVIGHHPHVPQGVEQRQNGVVFYSLGNFVFRQNDPWTDIGLGVEIVVERSGESVAIGSMKILPVRAGLQPRPLADKTDRLRLLDRLTQYSTIRLADDGYAFRLSMADGPR